MEHDECCLFHGKKHRSEFQFILNFLRKNCVTVKIDFTRAALLVCCCRLNRGIGGNQSCQDLLSGKDTPAEDQGQGSGGDVEKSKDKELLKNQDGALQSVLKLNMIPAKVQVILEKWLKRNPDAESHVHYGNSRISALMMLCLKGKYKLLLKLIFEPGPREHVLILPIPQKLVKAFFELDMTEEREKLGFTYEVIVSPLTGLSVNETFLKVTCDKQNIKAVRILLVSKAKELTAIERESAESDSDSDVESDRMSPVVKRKRKK